MRIKEIYQAIDIIRQCIAKIPQGPVEVPVKGFPKGEWMTRIEQPRGEALYYVKANGTKIVNSGGKAMCRYVIRSAGLKLKGQSFKGGLFPCHLVNHLSSALIRWKFLQPSLLAIEHANARWSIHLMAAKGIEVTIHVLHVNLHVRRTLCSIYHDRYSVLMGYADNVGNWINCSKHVTDMSHAHQFSTLRQVCCDSIATDKTTVIGNGQVPDHDATFHRLQLPRDDVRVVFHLSDQYLVARLHL